MFEMALNSFVISEINLYLLFEGIHLKININLGKIFVVNPNLDLKSRNFQWLCYFQGRGCG